MSCLSSCATLWHNADHFSSLLSSVAVCECSLNFTHVLSYLLSVSLLSHFKKLVKIVIDLFDIRLSRMHEANCIRSSYSSAFTSMCCCWPVSGLVWWGLVGRQYSVLTTLHAVALLKPHLMWKIYNFDDKKNDWRFYETIVV